MLQADTEQMYQIWIKALQQGIGSAIQGNNNTSTRMDSRSQSNALKPSETKRGKTRFVFRKHNFFEKGYRSSGDCEISSFLNLLDF